MPYILPHSHFTLLTTKYATYSSSQPLHNPQHKLCHLLFLAATPHCSPQDMPRILPQSYSTLLSISAHHIICHVFFLSHLTLQSISAHLKIFHVFFLTATPNYSLFLLTAKYAMYIPRKYRRFSFISAHLTVFAHQQNKNNYVVLISFYKLHQT